MLVGVPVVISLVVLASTAWVWYDARSRDWSGSSFAKGPWQWVIGSLLLWVIVFPIYLFQRGKAPART
jgi:hypothetical protein